MKNEFRAKIDAALILNRAWPQLEGRDWLMAVLKEKNTFKECVFPFLPKHKSANFKKF